MKNKQAVTIKGTPQVLLLGNGVNLAYGGDSWSELIRSISVRDDFDTNNLDMPMPLQAILMTNNNVKDAMKSQSNKMLGVIKNAEQMSVLKRILKMGFDDILTTNYSYELEHAGLNRNKVTSSQIKKVMRSHGHAETRYMLHTYNEISLEGITNRIWHIHGESRKPDSMILGHYWYGNMLSKLHTELDKKGNKYYALQNRGIEIEYNSWIDSFILGNVFVLGFGFDLSEIDLWWLLNRKQREKAEKGRMYFYEMRSVKKREKIELLKLMDVEVVDFGMESPDQNDPNRGEIYKTFYQAAIVDIAEKMEKEK